MATLGSVIISQRLLIFCFNKQFNWIDSYWRHFSLFIDLLYLFEKQSFGEWGKERERERQKSCTCWLTSQRVQVLMSSSTASLGPVAWNWIGNGAAGTGTGCWCHSWWLDPHCRTASLKAISCLWWASTQIISSRLCREMLHAYSYRQVSGSAGNTRKNISANLWCLLVTFSFLRFFLPFYV